MSLLKKIVAKKKGISPGQLLDHSIHFVEPDHIYVQDGNIPTVAKIFRENGFTKVFDPHKISCFIDHAVLSPAVEMSNRLKEAEAFVHEFKLNYYRAGQGISHVLAMEKGIFKPYDIVLGADSHTCTGGAAGCLALGMGASDIVYAMVTGKTWIKIPETIYIHLEGRPMSITSPKDVILFCLSQFRYEDFLYKEIIWNGDYFTGLPFDGVCTMASMGVEQGAKISFFPGTNTNCTSVADMDLSPPSAATVINININGLPPYISAPPSPQLAKPFNEFSGKKISYVFIGTCTNSRFTDIAKVAEIFRGKKVHPGVQCIISPGSVDIYKKAIENGLVEILLDAGALITPPGCGVCVGTQGSIPSDSDVVFSTMNRNFTGRMGNKNAPIYLGSPHLAAVTALLGHIPDLHDLE